MAGSPLPRQQVLDQLEISKSTYYRWLKLQAEGRLQGANGDSYPAWNRLRPEDEQIILARARAFPELTIHQLTLRITDYDGVYVSESTVYRILKKEGLINSGKRLGFNIGKEYHRKTIGTHELWVIDSVCINMFNRGWYHLVTVMDDYSRFILSWNMQLNMTEDTLSDLLQEAVDLVGMIGKPVEDRTALGSSHGASNLYWRFIEYMRLANIKHVIASPYQYETNGEMEMNHSTMSGEITLLRKQAPGALEAVAKSFVQYHNYMRYDKTLGYVTPFHVYMERDIIMRRRRREVKRRTLEVRMSRNRTIKN